MRSVFLNVMTIAIALCLAFVLVEIGIRLFLPVTDHPYTSYDPDVGVHLTPKQEGTMTLGAFGDFKADYRVNNAGWNSVHDYQAEKTDDTLRIAVVGDSFIEALGVDFEQGLHVVLEERLNGEAACAGYDRVEVYPFGYSGSPMSQYVSMMRYAKERYDPDVFIVHIFPINDFEPSLTVDDQDADSHVLTYQPNGHDDFVEVSHVPFEPSALRRFVSKFATVRYILFNLNIKSHPWIQHVMTPSNFYGDAGSKDADLLARFTKFVFGEYQIIADDKPLLITADGDRKRIYVDHGYGAENLNDLDGVDPEYFEYIEEAVAAQNLAYLPLHPVLESEYAKHQKRFELVKDGRTLDGHWNARAHNLIGNELANWVASNVCAQAPHGSGGEQS